MTTKDEVVGWFKDRGISLDPSHIRNWTESDGVLYFVAEIPKSLEVRGVKSTRSAHIDKCLIDSREFKLLP